MSMPGGSLVVGKTHRYGHLSCLSLGRVLVSVDDEIVEGLAPWTYFCPAGIKRVLYALEDSVWTTFHGTQETDITILERDLVY